jgi:hypothetical protein
MNRQQMNRASGFALILLSLTALLTVLSGFRVSFEPFSIHPQPPLPDEGTQAHLFQLAILALAPTMLIFFATADWKRPFRSAGPLALSTAAVVIAFGALYYLEHHR